ncbi:MAG: ABC transporter permease [Cyanobacteria bacterium P01_F01_bin.150]
MELVETFNMAWNTLTANKFRSSLTMLGIIIGNASVIAMVGIGQGAQKLAADEFFKLGSNHLLLIHPGSPEVQDQPVQLPETLVLSDAIAIANQVPTVKAVAPEINARELVSYRNKNTNTLVTGTTPEAMFVRNFRIAEGRFLNGFDIERSNNVVVLGSDLARQLFGKGNPIGKKLRIKQISFTVVGVMADKGSFLGTNLDDAVFIPISIMADQISGQTSPHGIRLSTINLSAQDKVSVPIAKFQITNLLRLRHRITQEDDFTVETIDEIVGVVDAITGGLALAMVVIAGISLIVGGTGIMNMLLVSVNERTNEIGLRKALGATQANILSQFLIEAIILSAIGGAVGIFVGGFGVGLIGTVTPLKAEISITAVLVSISVSGTIGLVFGVIPAKQAAELDPIVALRN